MPEDRLGDRADVGEVDVELAREDRAGLGSQDQVLRGPRAPAIGQELLDLVPERPLAGRGPGGSDEVHRVADHRVGHRHPSDHLLEPEDLLDFEDGSGLGRDVGGRRLDDRDLLVGRRVDDRDVEHEPVELRLGQGVGPFLLDRVLGRDDEERRVELVGPPADRDLALLHRLEERGLGLRWGSVDLVGEEELGEQRPLEEVEPATAGLGVFLDDVGPDDVRGHQVGRELDPVEVHLQGLGDGLGHQGLAQAGDAEHQDMPPAEQGHEDLVEHLVLADDHPGDLRLQAGPGLSEPGHGLLVAIIGGAGRLGPFHVRSGSLVSLALSAAQSARRSSRRAIRLAWESSRSGL